MSLFTQDRTINGKTYTVSQIPGRMALKVFNRLLKALGPAFAAFVGAAKQGGSKPDLGALDVGSLGGVFEALSSNLSDEDLDYFVDKLLETARVDNLPLLKQLDLLFMGDTLTLIRVLAFAVEVNYANFTSALAGFAGGAQVKEKA